MIPRGELVGLRTPYARHIENRVHRLAAEFNRNGATIPFCNTFLDPMTTRRQIIDAIAPAVVCARCVATARRWYAADLFITFDCVQRWRLLAALDRDLELTHA